jgi:hypothetical protein
MRSLIFTFVDTIRQLNAGDLVSNFIRETEKLKIIVKACLLAQQKLEIRENAHLTCIVQLINIAA